MKWKGKISKTAAPEYILIYFEMLTANNDVGSGNNGQYGLCKYFNVIPVDLPSSLDLYITERGAKTCNNIFYTSLTSIKIRSISLSSRGELLNL